MALGLYASDGLQCCAMVVSCCIGVSSSAERARKLEFFCFGSCGRTNFLNTRGHRHCANLMFVLLVKGVVLTTLAFVFLCPRAYRPFARELARLHEGSCKTNETQTTASENKAKEDAISLTKTLDEWLQKPYRGAESPEAHDNWLAHVSDHPVFRKPSAIVDRAVKVPPMLSPVFADAVSTGVFHGGSIDQRD